MFSAGSFLLFTPIQCSPPQRKMRYIATFQNTTYGQGFGLNSTVIGEAFWDDDKRDLSGVACRLLDPLNRSADEKANCRMRLSLSYTSVFTISNEPKLVGRYWSTSYFGPINLIKSDGFGLITLPDVRYEFTKLGQVRRSSCAAKRSGKNTYPDVHSDKMQLDLSLHNLKGQQIAWVYASPLWVGNDAYKKKKTIVSPHNTSHSNMSYMISLSSSSELKYGSLFTSLNWSINENDQVEITAGVYDAETGCLYMVGCRNSDCEILVTLEFSQAKGSIKSTRAKTDPLYFHVMTMQSVFYYMEEGARTTWRMDLETAMVLVSNILICIFVALQINHVKRYPKLASSISLLMLVILSVGQGLRLILSMEGEVVRLSSLMAILVQLRLVQLVWERKPGCALLSLYVIGGLLAFVMNGRGSNSKYFSKHSVWRGLKSYGGLIVDGYFVTQVVLNAWRGGADKALIWPFYVGMSAVRVAPHLYSYTPQNHPTFTQTETVDYANPHIGIGFYSGASDIVFSFAIVALLLLLFLQQRRRSTIAFSTHC